MPAKVFFSYSHADEELRRQLEKHLALLQRWGHISGWHDRSIGAGSEWRREIDVHLREADLILLLISADFLASDYCWDNEMKLALERHERGEAVVVPVILRPVDWASAPFAKLQALPRDGRPVTTWPNRDEAFTQIAAAIRDIVTTHNVARDVPKPPPVVPASQDRAIDAAMPKRVTVDKAAELLAMVRLVDSGGLRAILAVEEEADVRPQDVRSREFALEFPLDAAGRPCPATITLLVEAPAFEPPRQQKQIRVPVDRDSQCCSFLLVPKAAGEHVVIVELLQAGVQQACGRLKTRAETVSTGAAPVYSLASLPLTTISVGSTYLYAAAAAPPASAAPGGSVFSAPPPPAPAVEPPTSSVRTEPLTFPSGVGGAPSRGPVRRPKTWYPLVAAAAVVAAITTVSVPPLLRSGGGDDQQVAQDRPAESVNPPHAGARPSDQPIGRSSRPSPGGGIKATGAAKPVSAQSWLVWHGNLLPGAEVVIEQKQIVRGGGRVEGGRLPANLSGIEVVAVEPAGRIRVDVTQHNRVILTNLSAAPVESVRVGWRSTR